MTARLGRLVVEGLRSVRRIELDLTTDVTVLIGANGSGKSNLVGALELVSRIWDGSFQDYLRRRGGMAGSLFSGAEGTAPRAVIEVSAPFPDGPDRTGTYRVTLEATDEDDCIIREVLSVRVADSQDEEFSLGSRPARRSWVRQASADPGEPSYEFVNYFTPLLEGCRVFHFDDVSERAPVKGWSTVGDDVSLRSDAENIAAYLLRLRDECPGCYRRIVSAVRHVTPFFDDFVLVPSAAGRVRLRWRQRGMDRTLMAREASDGTLRFICLATLLLGPDLPATVVLDEPELGLHPAAIALLAEMTHIAGRNGHRVIVATQSVPLLSHYGLDEVVVLDRVDGATQASRPSAENLEGFLGDYSIGTLWEMNLLGGRPVREDVRV